MSQPVLPVNIIDVPNTTEISFNQLITFALNAILRMSAHRILILTN